MDDSARRWAACGAMALTGDAAGPPLAPPTSAATLAGEAAAHFGLDAAVLAERAALTGLARQGRVSCGGATRLLATADGWLAMALPRLDDLALLPALLGVDAATVGEAWPAVAAAVAQRTAADVTAAAEVLGLACSAVGGSSGPFRVSGGGRSRAAPASSSLVVDLSSLWAGPLCCSLLLTTGARVIKVEDVRRPDGARRGSEAFFDLVNAGKASVALDFGSDEGRERLRTLVGACDVVVTSARARAFEHLGLHPDDVLSEASDKVWVAVTGYGWESNRVGFGDDAAAAAGLVAWHPTDGEPRFAADALADPLCGVMAAVAVQDALAAGGRWFIDASLAGAAAKVVGPMGSATEAQCVDGSWQLEAGTPVGDPVVRRAPTPARPLGADTDAVLAELARS